MLAQDMFDVSGIVDMPVLDTVDAAAVLDTVDAAVQQLQDKLVLDMVDVVVQQPLDILEGGLADMSQLQRVDRLVFLVVDLERQPEELHQDRFENCCLEAPT